MQLICKHLLIWMKSQSTTLFKKSHETKLVKTKKLKQNFFRYDDTKNKKIQKNLTVTPHKCKRHTKHFPRRQNDALEFTNLHAKGKSRKNKR